VKLNFDLYKRGKHFGVNVWCNEEIDWDNSFDPNAGRNYLDEAQYLRMTQWAQITFKVWEPKNYLRVRRISFADFLFKAEKDRNWFVFHYSGLDSTVI
jgi:hypothetical protein